MWFPSMRRMFSKSQRHAPARPRRQPVRPTLELLEDRCMPAALFTPVFGVEPQTQDGGIELNSPHIYFILWGSQWKGLNSLDAKAVEQAAANVLNPPNVLTPGSNTYLSGIQQYGSDGVAILGNVLGNKTYTYGLDKSDPENNNFDSSTINDVIHFQVDHGFLPLDSSKAIYVVVTIPGVKSDDPTTGGFNFVGDFNSIWLSTVADDKGHVNQDNVSLNLSNQVAAIMTDPGGNGVEFDHGANWFGGGSGNQINAYEGHTYSFRENNGALVQPVWSRDDNAWLAADGTTDQNLYLTPYWDANGFTGTYDLTVNGDQLLGSGGTADDSIFIEANKGSIGLLFNNYGTSFDPGYLRSITINTGDGTDTVEIAACDSNVPIKVNTGNGQATVTVDPNTVGAVTVNGGGGTTDLIVDESLSDPQPGDLLVTNSLVQYFGSIIHYNSINSLTINGGDLGNTFFVSDTPGPFTTTTINCGTHGSTVNVAGTSGPLNINTAAFNDVVNIGVTTSLQAIHGTVTVTESGMDGSMPATTVNIDDSLDTTPRTGTLSTIVGPGGSLYQNLTGLSPADIRFQSSNTKSASITTGMGNDTLNVQGIRCPVFLDSAGGLDTVNVGDTGPSGQPGTVRQIFRTLTVDNSHGLTALNVNDPGDSQGQSATISAAAITGLAPAEIDYVGSHLASLTVRGGFGGNSFAVTGTPAGAALVVGIGTGHEGNPPGVTGGPPTGTTVTLYAGNANETVRVGDPQNTLDGIQGPLVIFGQAGKDKLDINDQGSSTHSYTLTSTLGSSTVTRSGAAPITYDKTMETTVIHGGQGVNTYIINSPSPSVPVLIKTGGNQNALVGPNQPNTVWQILSPDTGRLGLVTFQGMQNLKGGGSSNTFHFTAAGTISGTIDGGAGQTNILDYGSTQTPIAVDLAQRSASRIHGGVAMGFTHIGALVGSVAKDTLTGPNLDSTWQITGANQGSVNGFQFSGIESVAGGTGIDTFRFGPGGSLSGNLDGGGGGDWLDYSARTTSIDVNLLAGSATSIGLAFPHRVTHIQHVKGSAGNNVLTGDAQGNILIGGGGTNQIHGGSGRSLLIGGTGKSLVKGGAGDDILIAGTTVIDAFPIALMAILKEWQRTDIFYTQRIDHLQNGGGYNGTYKLLWGNTVLDTDKPGTQLFGGPGKDWFFADATDVLPDRIVGNEKLNNA